MTQRTAESFSVLSGEVIGAVIEVHRQLGPVLLESCYRDCLAAESTYRGIRIENEVRIPLRYRDIEVENAYRLDLLVEGDLVVEIKAVDGLLPVHSAQLLTYLKLLNKKLGLLINFNVEALKSGVKRIANGI
ncbi:MAG: GxxExxY protein [Rhodocyclaceae bacterium]|nr:GxxExxY protein [Rhodocyclaceae bacterium]